MKKIIAFILIFVMIISSAALAEPAFTGAWATVCDLDNSVTEITLMRVFPDNTVYYSRQQFTESSIGEEEKAIYSWELENDNCFLLISDTGEEMGRYILLNEKRLMSADYMFARFDFYVRETPAQEAEPTNTPAPVGITVPSGVYIAGDDFPSGTYSIKLENEKNGGVIVLYENMEDTRKAFSYLHEYSLNKNNPLVGKMIIKDGNVLDVRNTIIVLLPYEGLQ